MTTTKDYDKLSRLSSISSLPSASSPVSFAYGYNTANQRVRCQLADGSFWLYEYDPLGQLVSAKHFWPDWTPVAGQRFSYTFDDIGNRTSTLAGGDENGANLRSASYSADCLNQYTSRDVPGAVDIMGLALATETVQVNGATAYRKSEYFRKELAVDNSSSPLWTNITVAASGETSVTGNIFVPKTAEQLTYDLDGNLTSDGRWTNNWDAENRLVRMESLTNGPAGSKLRLTFGYDHRSRRINKQVESWTGSAWNTTVSTKFLYDGWDLIALLNGTNNAVALTLLWGTDLSGTMQGAAGVGGLLAITDASLGSHFVAFDGNGNVATLITASDGTTSAAYEYSPFGEVLRATGPMTKAGSLRFSTKYQDQETDLLYYGFRYYASGSGTWISRDPKGDSGGPLYAFNSNRPLSAVDPLGLAALIIDIEHRYEQPPPLNPNGDPMDDADGMTWPIWSPSFRPPMDDLPTECGPGRWSIGQRDWKLRVLQSFAVSQDEAQSRIYGSSPDVMTPPQTLQQHEDSHLWYAIAYTTFAWNTVAIMDGKCVCEECYNAWKDWQNAAISLAWDYYHYDDISLDMDSYGGTPRERALFASLPGDIARLRPIYNQSMDRMKTKCGDQLDFTPVASPGEEPPNRPLPRPLPSVR